MNSSQFGQLALQLLEQSHIPGVSLDAAISFRDIARDLAEKRATIEAGKEIDEAGR